MIEPHVDGLLAQARRFIEQGKLEEALKAYGEVIERRPADVVTLAVRRMLPKTRLGRDILRNLKVYAGEEHPHTAQQPVKVESL